MDDLEKTVVILQQRIQHLLHQKDARSRILIALAGVPGSGKSTVTDALLRAIGKTDGSMANTSVLPMTQDGFHHTKAKLSTFDDPDYAFHRRGAPFTFDVEAFISLVMRLRDTPVTDCDEPEVVITAPSFDHAIGDPIPDAISISSRCRVVIVEGNYTLLDQDPWRRIAEVVDDKWFVDIQPEVARERLSRRHLQAGIEKTPEKARQRAEENDLPNGEMIRSHLIRPDIRIFN
ncbi:ArgK protein [Geosmithia morbida]|uniref:ArgK protein n=1 Tax=Geosmithia morbida TaxID=1094350 RepID=A0A9P4YQI4_9HYPO|nr:ArgK protein [Geosmithia morbida]KAF4119863.1 ArgK protein [Geosmithia morbida]